MGRSQDSTGCTGTLRTILPVIATALLISIVLFTPASADSGEVLVPSGGSHSWKIVLDRETRFSYDVEDETGGRIDLFLMTAAEHQRFEEGEPFTYIADGSFTSVPGASAELVLRPGTYYLVAVSPAGAEGSIVRESLLSFNISVETSSASDGLRAIMAFGVVAVLCLVIVIAFDTLSRRRKEAARGEEKRR